MTVMVDIDPRVVAMRERHGRERANLMTDFLHQNPWVKGDVDLNVWNWTPEEDAAWIRFREPIDARQQAERRALAVEMGYHQSATG